jgi:N-acetylated-alpha-linked acidic dipeptidase
MNTALERSLDILDADGNSVFSANVEEVGDIRDPEAEKYKYAVPAWHGLSADGDVTGELVYANYGTFDDYGALVEKGVNLTGKIALVRYGGVFRGLKIKRAEELGAAGVLIYSGNVVSVSVVMTEKLTTDYADPRDDGYVTVENGYATYPGGPARNPTSVQRGSVQYLSVMPLRGCLNAF